jgi:asparagine synthase (glutamine-hydrolysing)
VLAGAWGAAAGGLLERLAERHGAEVYRSGRLTMLEPPELVTEQWDCWLFGEPQDRGTLAARFGLPARVGSPERAGLAAVFGRALRELGPEACGLLQGRFVIVMLERDRDRCLVSRDQLGAQPLVHTGVGDGLLFAEHERDLLELLPVTPAPDRLALLGWIEQGVTPPRHTLYENLRRLPAGHRLTLSARAPATIERWWNLRYQGTETGTPQLLADQLREQAFAAITRATAGVQRPALKLSGGLDSACVAAGLAANGFGDGRGLALGGTFSEHPVSDESELIEATAERTGLQLERIAFDPASSILAPALAHIDRWRLPPATPNLYLWQPLLAQARALNADVMLDGEGGDELFGIAPKLIADMLRTGRLRTAWSLSAGIPGIGAHAGTRARLRMMRRFGFSPLLPSTLRRRREQRATLTASNSLVPATDALALLELHGAAGAEQRDGPLWWQSQAQSLIDERDALDVGAHFRREAADAQIERRHPFLYDLTLTEAALRLPPAMQFDPLRDRPLLRDGLKDLIPERVRTRYTKSHFTPLLLAAVQAEDSALVDPLRRADAPVRAYVDPQALARRIDVAPQERSLLGAWPLWRLAIANKWLVSQSDQRP